MNLREEFEDPAAQAEFLAIVRTSQIIWAALMFGPVAFAGIIVFLTFDQPRDGAIGFMTLMMAAFAVVAVVTRLVVPDLLVNQQIQALARGRRPSGTAGAAMPQTELGLLGTVYQTRLIIASALLEGATFGNLFAFMMERNFLAIAISILLWLGMAIGMPTASGAFEWAERQLRRLHELRSLK